MSWSKSHLVLAVAVAASRTTRHLVGLCRFVLGSVLCWGEFESDRDCRLSLSSRYSIRTTFDFKALLVSPVGAFSLKRRAFRAQPDSQSTTIGPTCTEPRPAIWCIQNLENPIIPFTNHPSATSPNLDTRRQALAPRAPIDEMAPQRKSKKDAHSINSKLALVMKSGKGTCAMLVASRNRNRQC